MKLKDLLRGKKFMTNLGSILKSKIANKVPSSQGYGFSSGRVWMWELDYKESRVLKNWCFWTVVLEKMLETGRRSKQSILKEINPEYLWKDWCWSWNSNTCTTWVKNWLIWKDPDAGNIEGRRRRGQQRMRGWMASPTQWTWVWVSSGVGDRQGGLACCNSWGRKESDTTERLNWTDWYISLVVS